MSAPMAAQRDLLRTLPPRLLNFFAKYPPQHYSAIALPTPEPPTQTTEDGETIPTATTNPSADELPSPYVQDKESEPPKNDPTVFSPSRAFLRSKPDYPNPFLPRKFGKKWAGPQYGLRKQADIVKLAIKYNVEPLLPPSKKSTEYKELRLAESGLRIKGTGIGQKVKGHKWERTMETRLEERKKAVQEMPQLINLWKQVCIFTFICVGCRLMLFREVTVVGGGDGPRNKGFLCFLYRLFGVRPWWKFGVLI